MRGVNPPLKGAKSLLESLGKNAKAWRKSTTVYSQTDIAKYVSMSVHMISLFENGKTNNAVILYKYLSLGFDPFTNYLRYFDE